ncbi:MAG TPA: hypothetical protein VFK30_05110, partial [Anaerolineae bacterium]|nr:hypothetical protein [Anaerolineae bacterium]
FLGYYPYVFLIKTPLLSLLGLLLGAIGLILRRDRKLIAFWSAPLIFFLAAIISQLNLGYRLILPALPFVIVLAGQGLASTWQASRQRWIKVGLIGLSALLIIEVLTLGSSHAAYFNLFVLDRDHDYNYLVDSNLDWGQDLIALRDWQTANHIDQINLAYYGTARPAAYHVQANLLPSFSLNDFGSEVDGFNANALPPGWYAISATSLQLGLLYTHWNEYAAFRSMTPVTRVGRSILVYHLTYASSAIDRSVVLGSSAGDLDRTTLGGTPDRQLVVKWAGDDAAVLDMQGPARYLAHGSDPIVGFAPEVHSALLANAQLLGSDASGEWRVFQIDARAALGLKVKSWLNSTVTAPGQIRLNLPLKFDGGLTLLGYDLSALPDQPIDLITYWRVDHTPAGPLAIFAHVLDAGNQIIAQRDGLNVRLSSLEPDDVIIQHFLIDYPAGANTLDIGLYDPITSQRMQIAQQYDHVVVELR